MLLLLSEEAALLRREAAALLPRRFGALLLALTMCSSSEDSPPSSSLLRNQWRTGRAAGGRLHTVCGQRAAAKRQAHESWGDDRLPGQPGARGSAGRGAQNLSSSL